MKLRWSLDRVFRGLVGLFFLIAGVSHLLGFSTTVDGARLWLDQWPSLGFCPPEVFAVLAISALIFGGVSFLTQKATPWGALALFLFLVAATQLHRAIMEVAENTALTLNTEATPRAQASIDLLASVAQQGHQGNVMKNLVLCILVLYLGRKQKT